MDIEVGEYVRTKDGYIAKCTDTDGDYTKLYWFNSKIDKISGIPVYDIHEEQLNNIILKHSKDIIDLIEVDDIVQYWYEDNYYQGFVYNWVDKEFLEYLKETKIDEDIKSIVTKEQFKNIEYRLEE